MDSDARFAALLIGQPVLRQRLRLGVLAALDQRIAVRYTLTGMTAADTADYIRHHCRIVGRDDTLFSDDATMLTHNAARADTPVRSTTSPCTPSPPPSPATRP